MGLKILNTKDQLSNPITLMYLDAPGNMQNFIKSSKYAFQKVDLVVMVHDILDASDAE